MITSEDVRKFLIKHKLFSLEDREIVAEELGISVSLVNKWVIGDRECKVWHWERMLQRWGSK